MMHNSSARRLLSTIRITSHRDSQLSLRIGLLKANRNMTIEKQLAQLPTIAVPPLPSKAMQWCATPCRPRSISSENSPASMETGSSPAALATICLKRRRRRCAGRDRRRCVGMRDFNGCEIGRNVCDRISSVIVGRVGGLYARANSARTGPRDADRQAELSLFRPCSIRSLRIAFCGRNRGALRSIFSRQCNVDLLMDEVIGIDSVNRRFV